MEALGRRRAWMPATEAGGVSADIKEVSAIIVQKYPTAIFEEFQRNLQPLAE
jgi:hypothetical protein